MVKESTSKAPKIIKNAPKGKSAPKPKNTTTKTKEQKEMTRSIVKDVVAVVDVGENKDLSETMKTQLSDLGIKVKNRIMSDVTHIIFKDGKKTTWSNATKKGLKLVSPEWVEACKKEEKHITESDYPAESLKVKTTKTTKPKKETDKTKKNKSDKNKSKEKEDKGSSDEKLDSSPGSPLLDGSSEEELQAKDSQESKDEEKKSSKTKTKKNKVVKKKKNSQEEKSEKSEKSESVKSESVKSKSKSKPNKSKEKIEKSKNKEKVKDKKEDEEKEEKKEEEKNKDKMDKAEKSEIETEEMEIEPTKPNKKRKRNESEGEDEDESIFDTHSDDAEEASPKKKRKTSKSPKKPKKPQKIFVFTGLSDSDKHSLKSIIESKEDAIFTEDFSTTPFTHIVVNEKPKRTLKVLFAIARGAHFVSPQFVYNALDSWPEEGEFTVNCPFSDTAERARNHFKEIEQYYERKAQEKKERRKSKSDENKEKEKENEEESDEEKEEEKPPQLLLKGKKIALLGRLDPKPEILGALIRILGGTPVMSYRICDMCIVGKGAVQRALERNPLSVDWLFDLITHYEVPSESDVDAKYAVHEIEKIPLPKKKKKGEKSDKDGDNDEEGEDEEGDEDEDEDEEDDDDVEMEDAE